VLQMSRLWSRSMSSGNVAYSYGPVPSRRLGKSMGINNIPSKVCTYSCVYCQVGRTTQMRIDRGTFYDPEAIARDVAAHVAKAKKSSERVDYMTFVPDGEPTLDVNLGEEINLLKTLDVPVGVITNSSLLWRDDVRKELCMADWVSVKVDSVREATWRRVNRPHRRLEIQRILEGITAFAESFTGQLVTETMLVGGINDESDDLYETAEFLKGIGPSTAYLSVPLRPPAENWSAAPGEVELTGAFRILSDAVRRVEYLIGYEGDAFASSGDAEKDLLSITAVHPMRDEAVAKLLERSGASRSLVERLVTQGDLVKTRWEGHDYYLRKFKKDG
jgi:wyosine [tRNA(Phe)-imidazoG37] synthetase (radical SAM superfamily)